MSRYEDMDGIDGPWERALRRSMRDDARDAAKELIREAKRKMRGTTETKPQTEEVKP